MQYQKETGSLLYLALKTRPDIAYAIITCARFMSKPDTTHFKALDNIWKYLNKFPNIILYYNCNFPINYNYIRGYCDASWASDLDDRKSISGYCFYIYNNIISWQTAKQKAISLSSTEAEYIAFKEATKEAIWLNNLFYYINKKLSLPLTYNIPPILTDCDSAIKIAENPEFHKRSKHIDLAFHYTRDNIRNKKIRLFWIKRADNIADFFTKPLEPNNYMLFKNQLSLAEIPHNII